MSSIFPLMYTSNKTIMRFSFCDVKNNQGLGKGFRLSLQLITPTSNLTILDIIKTSPKNCLASGKTSKSSLKQVSVIQGGVWG